MQEKVLAAFDATDPTAAQVLQQLEEMKRKAIYEFAGPDGGQSHVNIVAEWVKAVKTDRAPTFRAVKDDQFLVQAQSKLKCLLRVTEKYTGQTCKSKETVHVGDDAMSYLLAAVEAKVQNQEAISLADLKAFDTWQFLMAEDGKAKHKAWVTACFKKAGSAQTKVAKQDATPAACSVKREAAASSASASSSSIANLFKRRRV